MTDTSGNDILSTDADILSSIGEGDEQTPGEGTTEEGTGTATDAGEAPSTTSGEQGTKTGDGTEQQQKPGGPQDLKDGQGNVIATAGKERRFYETAQREKARSGELEKQVSTLTAQIEAINTAGTLGTQYGLTPEELTTGAQLIASYKKDARGTIEYMLAQAQASGHNMEGLGASGGADMVAIKQLLDTALKPILAEQTERADTQAANEQAVEIYNALMTEHPDATVHDNSLARLLNKQPSLSPEAAYFKLKSYYLENNLDFTKSLETLQQEQNAAGPSANTQQALPEGGVAQTSVTDQSTVADVNTSTDDIIRQAIKEAGIQ